MNSTLNKTQRQALIAAGIDPEEFLAPEPKADGRNHEARAHNYAARMTRREETLRGGLKKAERRELAAVLRAELGREYTEAEWEANLAAYKAGEFTLVDFS